MSGTTYYQRNKDVMLNKAKAYSENNKERLRDKAKDKYKNLSEEDKNEKREYRKTDIIVCLRKRNKNQKNIKKIIAWEKSINIIMNKIVYDLIVYNNK